MEDTENLVPEPTAANPDGGAERLDADPISQDTSETIDALLDEAELDTNPETHDNNPANSSTSDGSDSQHSGDLENLQGQPEGLSQSTPNEQIPSNSVQHQAEIDPEILAIEQPRNLSEKNQNNWRKLQETASLYKKQAEEAEVLRQRLAEAEQRPAQTPEDYEELKKFRAIFDIKNDPSFRSKYEEPIKNAKEGIYGILRKHGASDDIINGIEAAGGPEKVDHKWWEQNALSKLPFPDAERLKRSLVDIVDLKEKQDGEISHAAEHAEQILEERQNQSKNWYQQETTSIRNYVDDITKEAPWARYQDFPAGATQEQIEKIQQHNQAVQALETKFNSALWPQTAGERASVAAAAVLSHVLTERLRSEQSTIAQMSEQLKRLTDENSKLKGASRIPKQNVASPSSYKSNDVSSRIKMNASDAIDLGLDEAGA